MKERWFSLRFLEIWISRYKVWFVNKLFNSPATASNLLCVRDHKRFRNATMNVTQKKRKSSSVSPFIPPYPVFFHLVRSFLATCVPRTQLSRRTCIQREVIKMESGWHLHVYSTSLIPSALSFLPPVVAIHAQPHARENIQKTFFLSPLRPENHICGDKKHEIVFCVLSIA